MKKNRVERERQETLIAKDHPRCQQNCRSGLCPASDPDGRCNKQCWRTCFLGTPHEGPCACEAHDPLLVASICNGAIGARKNDEATTLTRFQQELSFMATWLAVDTATRVTLQPLTPRPCLDLGELRKEAYACAVGLRPLVRILTENLPLKGTGRIAHLRATTPNLASSPTAIG